MSESDRVLTMSRHYAADPMRVFRAWTDPAKIDRWWGPDGFQTSTSSMAVEVGGEWHFVMVHPEWGTFPNRVRYREVAPGARLVYEHDTGEDDDPAGFHVVVTFVKEGEGTRLTMRSLFKTVEAKEHAQGFGAEALGQQTLARFGAHLQSL